MFSVQLSEYYQENEAENKINFFSNKFLRIKFNGISGLSDWHVMNTCKKDMHMCVRVCLIQSNLYYKEIKIRLKRMMFLTKTGD